MIKSVSYWAMPISRRGRTSHLFDEFEEDGRLEIPQQDDGFVFDGESYIVDHRIFETQLVGGEGRQIPETHVKVYLRSI